jgi:NitT/TauT family transport system substrate-binding protein
VVQAVARAALGALLGLAAANGASAQALTKVSFGTDWLAQAEHGGFYQAVAAGIYKKHGLDVTIRMGGPSMNVVQNIAAGVVDFQLGSESFFPLNFVEQKVPVTTVAAFFQKNPRAILTHPGQGLDSLEALKGRPILISASARTGFWAWLKARYGYADEQIRPYNFSPAPFLADKKLAMQGLLTSEPYSLEKEAGVKPVILLLSDHGFDSYSDLILAQTKLIREKPQVVKAFVEASIEGWYSYLYGDPSLGNALILKENPEMTVDRLAVAIQLMKQYGIVDSGDSLTLGIGAMTEARWRGFVESIRGEGIYPADLDWKKAYTTEFVNKRYAITLKK